MKSIEEESFAVVDMDEVKEVAVPRNFSLTSATAPKMSAAERRAIDQEYNAQLHAIDNAIHNRTIAKAKINGVQTVNILGRETVCLAFALKGGIKGLIPYNQSFMTHDPIPLDTVTTNTPAGMKNFLLRQRQAMEKLLDADIRYLPKELVEDEQTGQVVLVGSRTEAMEIERGYYFLAEKPIIKQDTMYEATVISVAATALSVQLGGIEKVIPAKWVTNRYAPDLRQYFTQNQKIKVVVRRLKVENGHIDCDFDLITGELMDCASRSAMVVKDELTFATLSKVLTFKDSEGTKRTSMLAWIEGWDLPARMTSMPMNRLGIPLKPGDIVRIKITGVDADGYVRAYVRSAHGTTTI